MLILRWAGAHRRLIETSVTLLAVAALPILFDLRAAFAAISAGDPARLFATVLLTLMALGLALVRFQLALRLFGFPIEHRELLTAFTAGQFSNQFLANIFGQCLTRSAMLRAKGVPASVTTAATWVERLIALALLFSLSLAAAFLLAGRLALSFDAQGAQLLVIAMAMIAASAIGISIGARRHSEAIAGTMSQALSMGFVGVVGLTVAIQLMTVASFLTALAALGVDSYRPEVAAAIAIVMFVTSLPISFGGWGVRELSSAYALSFVAVSSNQAIAGAVIVGFAALAAMGIFGLLSASRTATKKSAPLGVATPSKSPVTERWDDLLLWWGAILVASLLFFQVQVPLGANRIAVNPADLIAISLLGAAIVARIGNPRSSLFAGWIWTGMWALTALLVVGFAIGYANFGLIDWAFFNRGVGWLVILGYVVAGVAASRAFGLDGRDTVLFAFAAVGVVICVWWLVALCASRLGVPLAAIGAETPMEGFAGNSNAFALQLTIVTLVTFYLTLWKGRRRALAVFALTLTSLTIYYTYSRTGASLATIAIACGVMFCPPEHRKSAAVVAVSSILLGFGLFQLLEHANQLKTLAFGPTSEPVVVSAAWQAIRPGSDGERLESVLGALRMWLDAPIFGRGLGSFVATRAAEGKAYLIIHSTPVWILAEFGAVGLVAVVAVASFWIRTLWSALSSPDDRLTSVATRLLLAIFIVGNLPHDLAFQRAFWFLFGVWAGSIPIAAFAKASTPGPYGLRLVQGRGIPFARPQLSIGSSARVGLCTGRSRPGK